MITILKKLDKTENELKEVLLLYTAKSNVSAEDKEIIRLKLNGILNYCHSIKCINRKVSVEDLDSLYNKYHGGEK